MFTTDESSLRLRRGVRLELVTAIWMVIEAAVSIGAGIVARSALLTAFGVDSLIELASGAVLLWRLMVQSRGSDGERTERAEHITAWVTAIALVLLCLYVLATSIIGLHGRSRPEESLVGIVISALAVIVMPWLAFNKRRVAASIGSAALRADATNSLTCGYMAATVLLGLALNAAFHWWWAEHVAALLFLLWLVWETKEALEEAALPPD